MIKRFRLSTFSPKHTTLVFLFALFVLETAADLLPLKDQIKHLRNLGNAFVPIHTEWPYVQVDMRRAAPEDPIPYILSLEDLSGDRLNELSENRHSFTITEAIPNAYILKPTKAPEASIEISVLDLPVDIETKETSTWEALVKLCEAVSADPSAERPLILISSYASYGGGPKGLRDVNSISVSSRNRTAREVLLEIFAQSPLTIGYKYEHGLAGRGVPVAQIIIFFLENGKSVTAPFSPEEEVEKWAKLQREARDACFAAWESKHGELPSLRD